MIIHSQTTGSPPVQSPKHPRIKTGANFRIILCEPSYRVAGFPLLDRGYAA
jgi:hypothetical protein